MQHIRNAEAIEAVKANGDVVTGKATEPRAEPKVRFLDDFRSEDHIFVFIPV